MRTRIGHTGRTGYSRCDRPTITSGGRVGASVGIGCAYVKGFGLHVFIVYSFGEYYPPSESKCQGRTPAGNSWALVQSALKAITGS